MRAALHTRDTPPVLLPVLSVVDMTRRRTTHVCTEPGCPELTEPGRSRCELHRTQRQRADDRQRGSSTERGYDAAWRKNRSTFLAAHRTCIDCGQPATVADHDPTPRRVLVERGDPTPDAWHHLKPRCQPCHARRTYGTERDQHGKPRT